MVIRFLCKTHYCGKRETSQSDISLGCGPQLTYLAASKILDEELFFSILQEPSKASKRHRLALSSFWG
jgi:hypothetical protein